MRIGTLLLVALLGGCASNGYQKFYTELPVGQDALENRAAPPPAQPKLDKLSGDFKDYASQYARAAYVPIGYSSYNGPTGSEDQALAQGKSVGADVVAVMSPRYTETLTSSIPITTPTTQTSQTNSTATVYGSGGTANGYGSSTTTTYGSRTTYLPVTTQRYDFQAIYLVKRKYTFGAQFDALSDEERAQIQSNKGVKICEVVNDTPAFEADVLVGDIILSANGRSLAGPEALAAIIGESAGGRLDLAILRNGQSINKSVQLLP
jgi:hypothetical protein